MIDEYRTSLTCSSCWHEVVPKRVADTGCMGKQYGPRMDIDDELGKRRAAHRESLTAKRQQRGPRMDRVPIRSGVALTNRLRAVTVADARRPVASRGREVHGVRVCPHCAVSGHSLH